MLPQISMPVVDVQDVAEAHIRALKIKEAAGRILTSIVKRRQLFKEITSAVISSNITVCSDFANITSAD